MQFRYLKRRLIAVAQKIIQNETIKGEIFAAASHVASNLEVFDQLKYQKQLEEYTGLGQARPDENNLRDDLIFITARFRSGSTFLWNIFRNIPQCTAYYEPLLHEGPNIRGLGRKFSIDPTHSGVNSYHDEFKNIPGLVEAHRSKWAFENLMMGVHSFDPELKEYLNILVANAKGRPVLQFNRVDFRLPWLRTHFPNAKILHLYRHPREQWMSLINNDGFIPKDYKWPSGGDFSLAPIHAFYLLSWWYDLSSIFPFLELKYLKHPYQMHYLLWRLSLLYGKQYAHYSIKYESLMESFESELSRCFEVLNFQEIDIMELKGKVRPRIGVSTWDQYADNAWFLDLESRAEELLANFFYSQGFRTGRA